MAKSKVTAVIPARMAASRFPGKPLAKILDLPMIEHVRRRVCLCACIDEVIVATCDQEIKAIVEEYGGKVIMTANTHERCTDRVEEAVRPMTTDIVVIVQGDEPLFDAQIVDQLIESMLSNKEIVCSNLLSTIHHTEDLHDANIVKTVLNHHKQVIYFSRSAIPFAREQNDCPFYRQTGLSAFRKEFLIKYSELTPTPLEIAESIDFLRILEHGYPIKGIVFDQTMFGVDEPEHVSIIEDILKKDRNQTEIYQKILQP